MNRLSMVWLVPTVTGMIALTVSGAVRTQDTASSDSKWNVSAEESESQLALAKPDETIQNAENTASVSEAETAVEKTNLVAQEPVIKRLYGPKESVEQTEVASSSENSMMAAANDAGAAANVGNQSSEEDTSLKEVWAEDGPEFLSQEEQQAAERLEQSQSRYSLDQQFKKLQMTLETADAYSLDLAEDYFGYGLLLREDGQFEEALDAFIDALHIQKVNYGIYSTEQRPALKALFETHYSLGNVEDFEDYLEKILWVESKNPDVRDDFSYKMLILVGNRYIDQFLKKPVAGQGSVQTLLRAKHHLTAAFTRHRDKPLTVALMPYGELALISFLERQLLENVDRTASMEDPRLRGSKNLDGRELALSSYLSNSFPRGSGLLKSYLKKAQKEENLPHVVKALISLGDFNQLFRRPGDAAEYYKLAWNQAQNLPANDEIRRKFDAPIPLPAFDYAIEREKVLPTKPTIMIPLKIDLGSDGRVENVVSDDDDPELKKYFSRARRIAKSTVFRPQIIDGEAQATQALAHSARVYARKRTKQPVQESSEQKK